MFCNIFLFLPNVFPQKHYVYGVVWASGDVKIRYH